MAELHASTGENRSYTTLIFIAVILLSILYFLAKGCTNKERNHNAAPAHHAAAGHANAEAETGEWDIDFNAPAANFEEISDKNINVRANSNYAIYGLGENILFDTDKNTIKPDAEKNLREVAGSIEKRFKGASVRVFGYTDAEGSAGYNKQLAEQRAQAVKAWLTQHGNIAENLISLHPVGEEKPVASNATEHGKQLNRRVEIVARGVENKGE